MCEFGMVCVVVIIDVMVFGVVEVVIDVGMKCWGKVDGFVNNVGFIDLIVCIVDFDLV